MDMSEDDSRSKANKRIKLDNGQNEFSQSISSDNCSKKEKYES